jgi:hypothetical protein
MSTPRLFKRQGAIVEACGVVFSHLTSQEKGRPRGRPLRRLRGHFSGHFVGLAGANLVQQVFSLHFFLESFVQKGRSFRRSVVSAPGSCRKSS